MTVRFDFRCQLFAGMYFLNTGLMGEVDGTDTYLHRLVDAVAFRVAARCIAQAIGLCRLRRARHAGCPRWSPTMAALSPSRTSRSGPRATASSWSPACTAPERAWSRAALQALGIDLGDALMSADLRMNARGFFEDIDIVKLDDALLDALGADWKNLALLDGVDWAAATHAAMRAPKRGDCSTRGSRGPGSSVSRIRASRVCCRSGNACSRMWASPMPT